MNPVVLSVVYCVAVAVASLFGGSIPHWIRLTHTRMQLALSFVAGVILGVGLLHMIPHGFFSLVKLHPATAIDRVVLWTMLGFLAMFFLERFFHFHQHEAPAEDSPHDVNHCVHEHDCGEHDHADHVAPIAHAHDHAHGPGPGGPKFAWGGAFIGMTLHGLMDGVALAAAVKIDALHGHTNAPLGMLFGIGTFLAVVLHKPFDALTIGALMAAGGWSASQRQLINLFYSLTTPLGVALFLLGANRFLSLQDESLGCILSFAGGAFICIATSDLLPELQFHSHDRFKLSLSLLLGIALAWGIVFLESTGHSTQNVGQPTPAPAQDNIP